MKMTWECLIVDHKVDPVVDLNIKDPYFRLLSQQKIVVDLKVIKHLTGQFCICYQTSLNWAAPIFFEILWQSNIVQ